MLSGRDRRPAGHRSEPGDTAEDGQRILVIPSDGKHDRKAYLLLVASPDAQEIDVSLLKVLINQAEMLYHQFMTTPVSSAESPLAMKA